MLNFRRLKQDISPQTLKKGKELFDSKMILAAEVLELSSRLVKATAKIQGHFDNHYECAIEIDRGDSTALDSRCDCPQDYDCQHLAAMVYFLEEHLDDLVVKYSKGSASPAVAKAIDEQEKKELEKMIQQAQAKEIEKQDKKHQKELLEEYKQAATILGGYSLFVPDEENKTSQVELMLLLKFEAAKEGVKQAGPDLEIILRLAQRSKPFLLASPIDFLKAIKFKEPYLLNGRPVFLSLQSFNEQSQELAELLMHRIDTDRIQPDERSRSIKIQPELAGEILSLSWTLGQKSPKPFLFKDTVDQPIEFSKTKADLHFAIEEVQAKSSPKLLINPTLKVQDELVRPEKAHLFLSSRPGVLVDHTYFVFEDRVSRRHLKELSSIAAMAIPEPLFGTFIENSLLELKKHGCVDGLETIRKFATLPYTESLKGRCVLSYMDGVLEASMSFLYNNFPVPASLETTEFEHFEPFLTKPGVVARNLVEEAKLLQELFQDFVFDSKAAVFTCRSEKKIVEFMTETLPSFSSQVAFECPENLLNQFIYDKTDLSFHLKESSEVSAFSLELKVEGDLNSISLDQLWDCIATKKTYIEIGPKVSKQKTPNKVQKFLVLDLAKLTPIAHLLDEQGIKRIENSVLSRPLWSLATLQKEEVEKVGVGFSISPKLAKIQEQILGRADFAPTAIPSEITSELRNYQVQGVEWLERLRKMHLAGILADDMGLGKTLQAIVAISQYIKEKGSAASLIVCPTSLVYNWLAECKKFNPKLKALVIDGTPPQRKKLLQMADDYHVVITSYSLLQKDIENYVDMEFGYAILDEAHHIKNRGTLNAKSVKQIKAKHRLILSGTPIENSLDELWSLFDYLMPGLLGNYERFVDRFIRGLDGAKPSIETLKLKVSPFILRRMKKDVLDDLPPVSDITYHCHLSKVQEELYNSYAKSAREELSKLVQKEGFDKVQIHVLATLTRLKQICCHPAIFAKEKIEENDSAKYDLLFDLLQSLIEGGHKTVIFSQYTKMLHIIRDDLQKLGIPFAYLDGASKNRLGIVNEFNKDPNIPVFLISLKAGGAGLNLTGADTVIHYDIWWNPAVENQAKDRVHRLGQTRAVSSYKLVTLGTIEEKIVELQNRKRGLVTSILENDEEALSKLTWEEVLELLQT